jgi:hypothetical protein
MAGLPDRSSSFIFLLPSPFGKYGMTLLSNGIPLYFASFRAKISLVTVYLITLYFTRKSFITIVILNNCGAKVMKINGTATVPLANARQVRDSILFAPETGMIDTALLVKEYVKSVFGAASPQYKEVNHLKFRNKKI